MTKIKKIKSDMLAILYNKNDENCDGLNTAENIIADITSFIDEKNRKFIDEKNRKITFFDCRFDYYDEDNHRYTNFVMFEPKNSFGEDFKRLRSCNFFDCYNPFCAVTNVNKLQDCDRSKDGEANYTILRKIKFSTIYNKMIKAVNKIFEIDDIVNNDYDENKQILANLVKESGISKIILNYKRDMEFRNLLKYINIFLKNRKILIDTYDYKFWDFHRLENNLIWRIQVKLLENLEITADELFDSFDHFDSGRYRIPNMTC